MPTDHEHATVSLKVLLLIFGVVLVGTLTYLVWAQNSAPDITDYSSNKTATKTKDTTEPTTSTNGTTTTKNTTPPATDSCPNERSYTFPTEKLVVCFPTTWSNANGSGESFSYSPGLIGGAGGSYTSGQLSINIITESTPISYEVRVVDSFTLNGGTAYLIAPVGFNDEGALRLSGCSATLCYIPAKNTPGAFLNVNGTTWSSLPGGGGTHAYTDARITEVVKSLHY